MCTRIQNSIAAYGGGIYVETSDVEFSCSSNTNKFMDTQSTYDGGFMFMRASIVSVRNTAIVNSMSGRDGGSLYASEASSFSVYSSLISYSVAGRDGGAFYLRDTQTTVQMQHTKVNHAAAGAKFDFAKGGVIAVTDFAKLDAETVP